MNANITTMGDLLGVWTTAILSGKPPTRYSVPSPFDRLDLRPGRLLLLGGAPGQGKTAALLQIGVDLLRSNPDARLLLANVEMPGQLLFERVLARMASVPLTAIADRVLTPGDQERIRIATESLKVVAPRLAFLGPPFELQHVAAAGTEFQAGVFILDYLQRFTNGKAAKEPREQLDSLMAGIRLLCDKEALVLAAAAVARQKSGSGSSNYNRLNLASFRGSSELEFGSDQCYLLDAVGGSEIGLKCAKNRYGEVRDIPLFFDRDYQRFEPARDPSDALQQFDNAASSPKGGSCIVSPLEM